MQALWARSDPATVREILAELNDPRRERALAYTTVMTVADHLYSKGWLERELVGRAYMYRPTMTRDDYSARVMHDALSESADQSATLLRFVTRMTSKEARALRGALERAPIRRPRKP